MIWRFLVVLHGLFRGFRVFLVLFLVFFNVHGIDFIVFFLVVWTVLLNRFEWFSCYDKLIMFSKESKNCFGKRAMLNFYPWLAVGPLLKGANQLSDLVAFIPDKKGLELELFSALETILFR